MENRGEKIALMWQNILTFRNWLEKNITKHKKELWDNILLVSIVYFRHHAFITKTINV